MNEGGWIVWDGLVSIKIEVIEIMENVNFSEK
jgi:hypothetical protein